MTGREFAIDLIQKSRKFALELTERNYGNMPRLEGERLLKYLRAQMWREYTLGVEMVARQMLMVPQEHKDIRVSLSEQISDEWHHARLFGERVEAFGGDPRISTYEPSDGDLALLRAVENLESPLHIAVIIQCTNEVVLHEALRRLSSPRDSGAILDDGTAQMIREEILPDDDRPSSSIVDGTTAKIIQETIMPDEGRHIKNGRLLLERMADDPALQEELAGVAQRHRENLWRAHGYYKTLASQA